MTTEEANVRSDMKVMYLSGLKTHSIFKAYGATLFGIEIINALDSIKSELTPSEIRTRKLNKVRIKLGRLQGMYNATYNKQLKHEERVRHFKAKALVLKQSITKLHTCIDKLNAV